LLTTSGQLDFTTFHQYLFTKMTQLSITLRPVSIQCVMFLRVSHYVADESTIHVQPVINAEWCI